MDPAELRLDGNAAAGLLMEIFGREMTANTTVCATCLARRQVGELHVYAHGMGTVVRCDRCGGVQMKIAIIRGAYAVDLRGVHTLRLRPA